MALADKASKLLPASPVDFHTARLDFMHGFELTPKWRSQDVRHLTIETRRNPGMFRSIPSHEIHAIGPITVRALCGLQVRVIVNDHAPP